MERIASGIAYSPKRHRSLATRLWDLIGLARQRRDLASLDAHLLDDIGITEAQARTEAQRSLWDAPNHWSD